MSRLNLLMTGAGAPGGPGIIRCFKEGESKIKLFTGDADEMASGRFLSENFLLLPLASEKNFIGQLKDICVSNDIQMIFPLVTLELFKLSEARDEFKSSGIEIVVSDYRGLSVANNKHELYRSLVSDDIDIPEFYVARNFEEIRRACHSLGYPERPVVIKPSVSNGSRGVRILDEEASDFDLLFNHKPNNLYSNLEKIKKILDNRDFPELLISEYLPGEEITVDTIACNGEMKVILIRTRDKMNGGISTAGTFINDPLVAHQCKLIIEKLNLNGPIGFQFKKSESNRYCLLEINPRIQGTSVSGLGVGFNLPLLSIEYFLDKNKPSILSDLPPTKFVRYYEEVFIKR